MTLGEAQNRDGISAAPGGMPTDTAGAGSASPAGRAVPGNDAGRELARKPDHELPSQPAPAAGGNLSTDVAHPAPPRKKSRKRLVLFAILVAALGFGVYEGNHWWTVGRFELSTDDAYLDSDMSVLSAKIGGYVASVDVDENQHVRTGQVIARLDDGDYRLAVEAARNKIDMQEATIDRIDVQIAAARAKIDEARANLDSAQAGLDFSEGEFGRKTTLSEREFASRQSLDTARADRDKARAAVAAAQAALVSSEANVSVLQAERVEAEETLKSLRTALDQAKRDLSFTAIRAPVDGVIGNKAVDVGELVQAGSRLAAVVPLDSVYVDANFKETQLEKMRAGQTATVTVDSYPDRTFTGEVESISPASGALFSLLPPENATGNFTKVVQRLPVRIKLSPESTADHALRPGMSAVVTVDIRTGPGSEARAAEAREASMGDRAMAAVTGLVDRVRGLLGLDAAQGPQHTAAAAEAAVAN
ncbi:membrane fusion protein (multidrug efflux system) [Amorphus suaedae]